MKVTMGGVDYELKALSWGEDLEVTDAAMEINTDAIRDRRPDGIRLISKKAKILQLVKALVRWTFRGLDPGTGELIKEGTIFEINEVTVAGLPPSHGNRLSAIVDDMNKPAEVEVKN